MGFGSSLQYSNLGASASGGEFGRNWSNHNLPYLSFEGSTAVVHLGSNETLHYTEAGGEYVPPYFVRSVLRHDSGGDVYTLTSRRGNSKTFSGATGLLTRMTDKFGNETTFDYNSSGKLNSVVTASGTSAVSYHYAYTSGSPGPAGLVESVTLRVGDPTSTDSDVRQIAYSYTADGDLELVTLKQNSEEGWKDIQTAYYRYHEGGLMKFALGDDAYEQLKSLDPENPNWPQEADDATVAQYADTAFTYWDDGRVHTVKTKGGKYTSTFTYSESGQSPTTANIWMAMTEVLKADGSTHTFYYNRSASLLLQKISEPQPDSSVKVWYPICQQFDDNARVVLKTESSAVENVDEATPTLFTLKANAGLNTVFEYDSAGNLLLTGLRKGAGPTVPVVTQEETAYDAHWVGGVAKWVPASRTVYREATDLGATVPATTYYQYEWHQSGGVDTAQMSKRTTVLPAVPGVENGDGHSATVEEHYDQWGFLTERVDELGVSTTYERFMETGALQRTVQDAGGLNLTTDYQCDALGRTTRTFGPVHGIWLNGSTPTPIRRAEWTQYLDMTDEMRTIRGYVKADDESDATVINPIQISISFAVDTEVIGGRVTEAISAVYSDGGVPPETTSFEQGSWVRWSTQHFDHAGEQTHSRLYHVIPDGDPGNSPENYAQTTFGYDSIGRQNQVTSPEGTIRKSVFNAMGWLMATQVGTSEANLVVITVNDYDHRAAGGDGNLTTVTQKVDTVESHDRIRYLSYDWRNRHTQTSANDGGPSGGTTILTVRIYDNLNNAVEVDEYQAAIGPGKLINRAASFFDLRNRQYRTQRFGVNTNGGGIQPPLTSETYYDQAGRVVRQTPAGKVGFTVSHYDAVGRVKKTFHAYGPGPQSGSPWNPADISTSTVQTQSEFTYDDAGNLTQAVSKDRFDDAAGTGELGDPSSTTQPKARVSYTASYPDALGRTQANADYGTNGGTTWERDDIVPARSATVLVSSHVFDDAGDQTGTTDPMGTVTKQEFDAAGRRTKLIENEQAGSGPDKNKTTKFEYNLEGNLRKLKAENPATGEQVTEWIYGVTISAGGSTLASNSLVNRKLYPDSSGTGDWVSFTYNRQGQATSVRDQAGTTHAYAFDKFGRILEDAASTASTLLDMTVKKITRSYEARGMLEKVSSFNTGSTPLNQVQFAYNAYSQLEKDWQSHSGAVNPSTTLRVGYHYANGTGNTVRPTGITYPDGTAISMIYDGTAADALSRPNALKEGSTTLCSYRYLGSGVVIGVKYDAASNVELTYEAGGTGDAGDKYTGLDRFGRLVETLWKKGGADQVRSKYGRNRFGGAVWRRDEQAHAQGVSKEDNYYWYDGLYQVKERQRGDLTGTPPYTGISNLQQKEDWTYDATGNWTAYADTNPANSQSRAHNKANEITQIASPTVNPGYDPAGNMLTLPKAPGSTATQYALKWDAWNRLVSVQDGATPVASYTYDGLTRRLTKTIPTSTGTEIRHYYYNNQWRTVEERVGNQTTVDRQYTWGLRDRWDLLRRRRKVADSADEYLYVLKDYLDPVAIVDGAGEVVERYAYDAFGNVRFLQPDFTEWGDTDPHSHFDWNFLFHAEFRDPDTGLYNYGYRYYATKLGRWLSRDPAGEVDGENRFCYVGNAPTAKIDEFGLAIKKDPASDPSQHPRGKCPNNKPKSNGCGPQGWKWNLVPNRPLGMADFTKACDAHDICYGTCDAKKADCDQALEDDAGVACLQKYGWMGMQPMPLLLKAELKACLEIAHLYFLAVSKGGDQPFKDAQKTGCECHCPKK